MRLPSALLILTLSCTAVHADAPWPEATGTIEEMPLLTPLSITVPYPRPQGDIRRPIVLRVHVAADGSVRRVLLVEGCGSQAHDEAVLYAMRSMHFRPKTIDDVPVESSLIVPLHLPLKRKPGT